MLEQVVGRVDLAGSAVARLDKAGSEPREFCSRSSSVLSWRISIQTTLKYAHLFYRGEHDTAVQGSEDLPDC